MEDVMGRILELAIGQGLWAALYIYLFFRMLKENRDREERYQATVDRLSGSIESGIARIQTKLDIMSGAEGDR